MTPRKHRLTRILTAVAFALTAAAGILGVPVEGADPVSAPAIFENPFD